MRHTAAGAYTAAVRACRSSIPLTDGHWLACSPRALVDGQSQKKMKKKKKNRFLFFSTTFFCTYKIA